MQNPSISHAHTHTRDNINIICSNKKHSILFYIYYYRLLTEIWWILKSTVFTPQGPTRYNTEREKKMLLIPKLPYTKIITSKLSSVVPSSIIPLITTAS
jgi:hypothetical protein